MKPIINIISAIAAVLLLASCREDTLDVYNGDNFVHFTPTDDNTVRETYNFATDGNTTETEVAVPLEIRLWGYLPDSDFRCRFRISEDGTTADEGDYNLPEESVFRKGFPADTVWIRVRRKADLLDTDYAITVVLTGADGHVAAPSQYLSAVITVTDRLTGKAPAWWNTTPALGEYSDMKFRVFNIYLGKYLDSLNGYTSITFEEEVAEFKRWWINEWKEGRYMYYADDGETPLYDTIPD